MNHFDVFPSGLNLLPCNRVSEGEAERDTREEIVEQEAPSNLPGQLTSDQREGC